MTIQFICMIIGSPATILCFRFLCIWSMSNNININITGWTNLIRDLLLYSFYQRLSHQDSIAHFDDYTTSDSSVKALVSHLMLAQKIKWNCFFFIFDRLKWNDWDTYIHIHNTCAHQMLYFWCGSRKNFSPQTLFFSFTIRLEIAQYFEVAFFGICILLYFAK